MNLLATCSNNLPKFLDIFISYESEFELRVMRLYNILTDKYQVKAWLDIIEIKPGDDRFQKTTEGIQNSKIMVCCITKLYPTTSKCKNDITLAYTNDKIVLVLMVDNMNAQDLSPIAYALVNTQKIILYEDSTATSWQGEHFEKIIQSLESGLGRKLLNRKARKQPSKKTRTSSIANSDRSYCSSVVVEHGKYPTIAMSTLSRTNEKTVQIVTITTEELIIEKHSKLFKEYEEEQLQLKNPNIEVLPIRKLRSTSLFQVLYGFNRMVLIESKQKFIITSSYNQSVVLIDINGNWLERRTLNGLIKQPWGICVNSNNEVFIGDNEQKCIFVFDLNWKLLRRIGDNISNGFFDMVIDNTTNEIFIANLFDSQLIVVDEFFGRLRKKVYIGSPTYLRLSKDQVFVLNMDYIYCLNKTTFEIYQTIKLDNCDYVYGLYVDSMLNIYTTAHDIDVNNNNNRSRDVMLYIIRASNRHVIKKVNIGLPQVNDLIVYKGRVMFLSDTHIDLFEYNGLV